MDTYTHTQHSMKTFLWKNKSSSNSIRAALTTTHEIFKLQEIKSYKERLTLPLALEDIVC